MAKKINKHFIATCEVVSRKGQTWVLKARGNTQQIAVTRLQKACKQYKLMQSGDTKNTTRLQFGNNIDWAGWAN